MAHRLGLMRLVELLEPAIGPSLQPWSVATSLILSQDQRRTLESLEMAITKTEKDLGMDQYLLIPFLGG